MSGIGHNSPPPVSGSFFLCHREWFDHWLVGVHNPEYCAWWLDILQQLNFDAGTITVGGHRYDLRAGEMVGAYRFLAKRWRITVKRVRTFVSKLEAAGLLNVTQKGTHQGTRAQVFSVNYYNEIMNYVETKRHAERHAQGHTKGTQEAHKGHETNKNKKNNNNNITTRETPLPDFSYGQDHFQLDPKGELQLINGERAKWLDCFGGNEKALQIAMGGFTPNAKYTQNNSLTKHARYYLNQQAQAYNRNAKGAAPDKRARIRARIEKKLTEQGNGGTQ